MSLIPKPNNNDTNVDPKPGVDGYNNAKMHQIMQGDPKRVST
jgi:hypothetical protein